MRPLSDETLILHYYGEAPDAEAIERRLAESPEDRARLAELTRILDAIPQPQVPERSEKYGAQVWDRIASRLEAPQPQPVRRPRFWLSTPQWAAVATTLALVAVSFLAGRNWPTSSAEPENWVITEQTRERVLLRSVSGHLERAEMLFVELANSRVRGTTDLSIERSLASELSSEGRLFREAARAAGETDVVALLEEVERLLLDLSHGPETLTARDLEQLQQRLEERDLLFRLRVVSARLYRASTSPLEGAGEPGVPTI